MHAMGKGDYQGTSRLSLLYFINNDFILKLYLLVIKDLKDKHSGIYLNSVLLETLKEYNIKYNITR